MTVHSVVLKDLSTDGFVKAELFERVDEAFAAWADDAWLPFVATAHARATAEGQSVAHLEHGHWEWSKKVHETSHLLPFPTLGITCDGQVQGLMMLQTDGTFSKIAGNQLPIVYVHFLASAPWNLSTVVPQPKYAGVGTVLLRAAVEISEDLGFKGRIGLHSLPQANAWYEKLGMTCLGPDAAKQNLNYYEMTVRQAQEFCR